MRLCIHPHMLACMHAITCPHMTCTVNLFQCNSCRRVEVCARILRVAQVPHSSCIDMSASAPSSCQLLKHHAR